MRQRLQAQSLDSDPLDGYNSNFSKQRTSIHSISSITAIIYITLFLILFATVRIFNSILPTPMKVVDERSYPDAFISERAIHDLKLLTSLGPRVTGSYENEVLAVNFFKREIFFIEQRAHKNQKIEVDFQVVSGSYFMDFKPNGAIHAYSKLQNVVVKLHGRSSKHSLLLNSHFDTVPTSPGGSDDGINCAIMLEILRKLSRSPERLQHDVIFLFNGGEEAALKASHGFITKHKWAEEIRAVINLESGGAGSKEMLFQYSNNQPWILNYYKQVPHPNAQVFAEEIFQSGIIPSDTDYRIFRDFKNISGLDFAYSENGYRYHTKYDGFTNIPDGTYQHTGDNVLTLTRLLGNAPELGDTEELSDKIVFYDFFGYLLINYRQSVAFIIHIIISLVSIILAIYSFLKFGVGNCQYILVTFGSILASWIISGISIVNIAFIIDLFKSTMSWYGNPWFLFGLYVTPTLICCSTSIVFLNNFTQKLNLSLAIQTQLQFHIVRVIWTFVLLLGTYLKIRSVYILLVPIIFQIISFIFIQIFDLQYSVRKWRIVYMLGTLIPCLYLMRIWQMFSIVLIPVCGRIGSDKNPEMIIGIVTCFFTILIFSFYVPFITIVNKSSTVLKFLLSLFLITFVIVTFTPFGFPYSGNSDSPTPQRFWIYHTSRIFRNDSNQIATKNSGFFILNWDRNAPNSLTNHVKSLSRIKSMENDCNEALFCGLPLANSRVVGIIRESVWIPAGQPVIHERTSLELISKTDISDTVIRFNFLATGPSHFHIAVSARQNLTLIATDLVDKLPENAIMWNNRLTYVILNTWGVEFTPLSFSLDFEVPKNWDGPIFDIAISGRCMHDRTNVKTPQYVQFLNEFPEWTDVLPYLATYESWVY